MNAPRTTNSRTVTVPLEIRLWPVRRIEHGGRHCICDRCHADYYDWFIVNAGELYPRRPGE